MDESMFFCSAYKVAGVFVLKAKYTHHSAQSVFTAALWTLIRDSPALIFMAGLNFSAHKTIR